MQIKYIWNTNELIFSFRSCPQDYLIINTNIPRSKAYMVQNTSETFSLFQAPGPCKREKYPYNKQTNKQKHCGGSKNLCFGSRSQCHLKSLDIFMPFFTDIQATAALALNTAAHASLLPGGPPYCRRLCSPEPQLSIRQCCGTVNFDVFLLSRHHDSLLSVNTPRPDPTRTW